MKTDKNIHRPGTLFETRPMMKSTLERLDRCAWQTNPEQYARRAWAEIIRMAGGQA